MKDCKVLLLPGWQDSGPEHWQSRWERLHGHVRVQQHDWLRPLRGDWCARLEETLLDCEVPVVLVAHSLGCHLVAAWAAHSGQTQRVRAALLVAPADVEQPALRPVLPNWSPMVLQPLPFRSVLLGSHNDPYCSLERAQWMAQCWGAEFIDYGQRGHINADAGLGDWDEGLRLLAGLMTGDADRSMSVPVVCTP